MSKHTLPWTTKEKREIAQLRKKGWSESRIRGWMKTGNNRRGIAPPLKERIMATKKAGKKTTTKKATDKNTKKATKPGRKEAAKPGRKAGDFLVGETLTAVPGKDDLFYKKFPRYKAYELLCKKGPMKTVKFIDAVEKLEGVKSRNQALGILTKLLKKECAKATGQKKAA